MSIRQRLKKLKVGVVMGIAGSIILLNLLGLSICQVKAAQEEIKGQTIKWLSTTGLAQEWWVKNLPDFEKKTGVKVEVEMLPFKFVRDKKTTAMVSGRYTYDVVRVTIEDLAQCAAAGWLEPVDDRLSSDMRESFVPGALGGTVEYRGHVYGIPFWYSLKLFYYNKKMLEKAGISEPPRTWDELVEQCQKIQAMGLAKTGMAWHWLTGPYLMCDYSLLTWSFGGEICGKQNYPMFNAGGGLKALQFMVDSVYKYKIVDQATLTYGSEDILRVFCGGDAAFASNWEYMTAVTEDPKESKIVGQARVALHPAIQGLVSATITGPEGFGIAYTAKHKDAAWELLKWMMSPEMQKKQFLALGNLPVLKNMYFDPDLLNAQPQLDVIFEQMKYAYDRPKFSWYPEFREILTAEVQNALARKKSPEQALTDAFKLILEKRAEYGAY